MKENNIVIHMVNPQSGDISWWIADENLFKQSDVSNTTLENFSLPDNTNQIIIFVPSSVVLLTKVVLPPISNTMRAQAALYAIEDQLAEDVQALHAVVSPEELDGKHAVVVVKNTRMEEWLKQIQAFSNQHILLLPDVFLVPWQSDQWQMISMGEIALVRTGQTQGFAVDMNNLPAMLKLQQQSMANINNISYAQAIKQLSLSPALNLLQGKYRISRSFKTLQSLWRWPLILVGLWLVIFIISISARYVYLTRQESILNNTIASFYQKVYPNATSIISPRERITAELNQLNQSAVASNFLNMLAVVGKTLKNYPVIVLNGLEYHNEQLSLNVTVDDFKTLEQFSHDLAKSNLQVKQNTATRENNKVAAALIVTQAKV